MKPPETSEFWAISKILTESKVMFYRLKTLAGHKFLQGGIKKKQRSGAVKRLRKRWLGGDTVQESSDGHGGD